MPLEYDDACDVDDARRPYESTPGVRWGELEGIRGFEALKELYEGLLDKLIAGAFSAGDDNVGVGLGRLPMVGTLSLLLARLLGMTLFRIPKPVNVSPLSGNLIGW